MARYRSFLLFPSLLVVCALAGGFLGPKLTAGTPGTADTRTEMDKDLSQIASVYAVVEANYAVPVNASGAIYRGAIPGMLRELDPHSNFFDPKDFARMREEQMGRYYGVGMLVGPTEDRDHTVVIQPFEGTPAYDAGLRPGDVIMQVDGKSTDGLDTDAVAALLKGPKGTTVHIAVHRVGHDDLLSFTLVRAQVTHNSVDCSYEIQPGVVYIHLTGFTETTTPEISTILNQAYANGNIRGLVFDLRDNPGGLLNQAQGVADMLLARGQLIVSDHGRNSPPHELVAMRGNGGHDFPLVVLVDNMTASAAEIVSGAVQDHDRGLIAGQTTFGKGLVQTVFPMPEDTGLALTTAHYYTPSGRLIQRPYEGVSVYDYFYAHNLATTPNSQREVKTTDTGRTVYGGGGITPDVELPQEGVDIGSVGAATKLNDIEQTLVDRNSFFDFSDEYLSKHPSVAKTWEPDDATLTEFGQFVSGEHLNVTPADITANAAWLKIQIRYFVLDTLYGRLFAYQSYMNSDPEVAKAVSLMPQAQALETRAKQVLEARQQGQGQ